MDAAKPKGFSATLAADVGMRVKVIAHQENRSASNVIEGAVKVFTLFPKDVRSSSGRRRRQNEQLPTVQGAFANAGLPGRYASSR